MTKIIAAILLALGVISPVRAQQVVWSDCAPVRVDSSAVIPLHTSALGFGSADNYSIGDMDITNADARAITQFLILVELFDSKSEHIVTIPFYNRDSKGKILPFRYETWLRAYATTQDTAVFAANESTTLSFSGPLVSSHCPDAARIVFVELGFADGSRFTYGSPAFRLDPILTAVAAVDEGGIESQPPVMLTARVRLDSHGTPLSVESVSGTEMNRRDIDRILSHCKFSPPVVSGEATNGTIPVAFILAGGDRVDWKVLKPAVDTEVVVQVAGATRPPAKRGGSWVFELSTGGAVGKPLLRDDGE